MLYPVVLLDVGETLIGPDGSFGEVYAQVFRGFGLDIDAETFERCIRRTWDAMLVEVPPGRDRYAHYAGGEDAYWLRFVTQTLVSATGEAPADGLPRRALSLLREAFRQRSAWQVYPDVLPALDALRDAGARLGIVSNWDSRLPRVLEMLELRDYFEEVGVSHLEGVEKPDPALFQRVLERMRARPADALHVGDLPEIDLEGARAAGIEARLVDRKGKLDPSYGALPDLSSLPGIALG